MARSFDTSRDLVERILRVLFLGLIIGGLSALAATALVEAVLWLNRWWLPGSEGALAVPAHWQPVLIIAVPTLGGLVVGLINRHIRGGVALGPPDLIAKVQARTRLDQPCLAEALKSAAAAIISLGSGASLGQYAPIVHLGGSIGQAINRWLRSDPTVSIACGVAAGIAAVFNAPIAGIVFAHEVVLRHYSLRAFAPVTVAATTGSALAKFVFHRPFLLELAPGSLNFVLEFFAFGIIGVIGAMLAISFMRLALASQQFADHLPLWSPLKPMLAGLALGLLGTQFPELLGMGLGLLNQAMTPEMLSPAHMSVLLIGKILAAALCMGFGFAGGAFAPSLIIGLLLGGLVGHGIEWGFPGSHSLLSVYALAGMAAVTSPLIGAPLTTILIVFELSHSYEIATVVMVSVVFSNVVAYRLFGRSLYDVQLKRAGIHVQRGRERLRLEQLPLAELLSSAFTRIQPEQTLAEARQLLIDNGHAQGYICRDDNRYSGMLSLNQIVALESSLDIRVETAAPHANADSTRFSSEISLWHAMRTMQNFVGESIPVVDPRTGQLRGVVYESALITAYLDNLARIREEESAAT